jgi:hypothetical protein
MQLRSESWMPVSTVTARLWALESMADTVSTRRRRLAPAVRRLAIAMTRRLTGRPGTVPSPRQAPPPQVSIARSPGVTD